MKNKSFILLIGLIGLATSCNMFDEEFLDSWFDESTKEFKSSEWDAVQPNVFAVIGELNTEPKDRLFPDIGELFYADKDETAGVCFQSTINQAKEYPDVTGWDGWGHVLKLTIKNIPVKVKDGELKFSKKTQTGTIIFHRWIGCDVLGYQKVSDCKISISGKLELSEKYLSNRSRLTGDIEVKIISPENDRWILHYKELVVNLSDSGYIEYFL